MFCNKCNRKAPAQLKFCGFCASPLQPSFAAGHSSHHSSHLQTGIFHNTPIHTNNDKQNTNKTSKLAPLTLPPKTRSSPIPRVSNWTTILSSSRSYTALNKSTSPAAFPTKAQSQQTNTSVTSTSCAPKPTLGFSNTADQQSTNQQYDHRSSTHTIAVHSSKFHPNQQYASCLSDHTHQQPFSSSTESKHNCTTSCPLYQPAPATRGSYTTFHQSNLANTSCPTATSTCNSTAPQTNKVYTSHCSRTP